MAQSEVCEEEETEKKAKKRMLVFLLLGFFSCLIGVCLLLYPWVSNYLYEKQAKTEITAYTELSEELGEDQAEDLIRSAREYNEALAADQTRYVDPFNTSEFDPTYAQDYRTLLMLSDSGVMGYVEIPSISVYLPVFHGTDSDTLLAGIGHMQGSSLPVGGEGTHAVLTGHSGLTGAKMFTDLNQLEVGDYFYFHILDETLAYQVISVTTVLPNVVEDLRIKEGEDRMTLVTCTPYGVNSHRLLVTGTRVEYSEEIYEESQEEKKPVTGSTWMKSYMKAVVLGIVISLFAFFMIFFLHWEIAGHRKENRKRTERKRDKRSVTKDPRES